MADGDDPTTVNLGTGNSIDWLAEGRRETRQERREKLANQKQAGDRVDTPDGKGVVVEVVTESKTNEEMKEAEGVPDEIGASDSEPMYAVAVEDDSVGVGFYRQSELSDTEFDLSIDPIEAAGEDGGEDEEQDEEAAASDREAVLGDWDPPRSWRKAEEPARVIALDAWASMGAQHGGGSPGGCTGTMKGKVASPDRFCASLKDHVMGGYTYWRGDSILPGE